MPSRRRLLRAAGSTLAIGITGCSANGAPGANSSQQSTSGTNRSTGTNRTSTTTASSTTTKTTEATTTDATTTTESAPAITKSDVEVGGSVLRQPSEDSPGRIRLWLKNSGDAKLKLFSGATPPLTPGSGANADDSSMTLIPDDRQYVSFGSNGQNRSNSQNGSKNRSGSDDRSDSLPPDTYADGCWKLTGWVSVAAIGKNTTLDPGDKVAESYTVYATANDDSCVVNHDFHFRSDVSFSRPSQSEDGTSGLHVDYVVSVDGGDLGVSGDVTADGSNS